MSTTRYAVMQKILDQLEWQVRSTDAGLIDALARTYDMLHRCNMIDGFGHDARKPAGLDSGRAVCAERSSAIAIQDQSATIKAMSGRIARWRKILEGEVMHRNSHGSNIGDDAHIGALKTIIEEMRGYE